MKISTLIFLAAIFPERLSLGGVFGGGSQAIDGSGFGQSSAFGKSQSSQVGGYTQAIDEAVGKVETESALYGYYTCTGVLVGPCLMLTSQACVTDIIDEGDPEDYVRFMPGYSDGYSQGTGFATWYWWDSRLPVLQAETDYQRAFDYVVVKLDTCLGNTNGYMCVKSFDPSWVGLEAWESIAYSQNYSNGESQKYSSTDGKFTIVCYDAFTNSDGTTSYLMYSDLPAEFSEQLGIPIFGWWDDEPCVIGLGNYAWTDDDGRKYTLISGGPGLEDLVRNNM
jgi:hypothetical protein